ncbi:MAG: hypothetical protein ABSG75_12020 [Syntrophales bacterium]
MKTQAVILLAVIFISTVGCASSPLRMPTPNTLVPNTDYQILGEGEGEATGIMLFQFIPIGQNDRFELAYERAVKSKGGDRLIDPVITEKWFWAWILNGYTTKVKGTVVKDLKK